MLTRLLLYILITLGASLAYCAVIIVDTRAELQHDPSAMAWIGFLPLIFPIFVVQSALVTTPAYLLIELFLFVRKCIRAR